MPDTIQGDSGTGTYEVGVTHHKQLKTYAETIPTNTQANFNGGAYNVNTDDITLTNDTETPILYFKNNEDFDVLITGVVNAFQTSTDGSATEQVNINVLRNPTAGTIVTNAVDTPIVSNRNFGSFQTLNADIFNGATGDTMTGGTKHIKIYQADFGRSFAVVDEILPKGTSIGIKITPPSGNTSLTCYAALICHLHEPI